MDEMEISDFSASILRVALEPREDGYADFRESLDLSTASGRNTVRLCSDEQILFQTTGRDYVRWKSSWNITSPFENAHDHNAHEHDIKRLNV